MCFPFPVLFLCPCFSLWCLWNSSCAKSLIWSTASNIWSSAAPRHLFPIQAADRNIWLFLACRLPLPLTPVSCSLPSLTHRLFVKFKSKNWPSIGSNRWKNNMKLIKTSCEENTVYDFPGVLAPLLPNKAVLKIVSGWAEWTLSEGQTFTRQFDGN